MANLSEVLMIVALWCGQPNKFSDACRTQVLNCYGTTIANFNTNLNKDTTLSCVKAVKLGNL